MAYADYDFYLNEYFGDAITGEDFPRLSRRASDYIRSATKGLSDRADGLQLEAVKKCTCAIADILLDESIMTASAFSGEQAVSSETVGGLVQELPRPLRLLRRGVIHRRAEAGGPAAVPGGAPGLRRYFQSEVVPVPAPKRLSRPQRLSASPAAGMFPHTVTLYNVAVRTDRGSVRSTVDISITLLRGVFLDTSQAAGVRRNGLEGADTAVLYVPPGVEAVDAVTGEPKAYLPPVEFWDAPGKAGFWTFAVSSRSAPGRGFTFFVKGLALPPEGTPPEEVRGRLEALHSDLYHISRVEQKDFGGLAHWEIGGV